MIKLAIIVCDFNEEITKRMERAALVHAAMLGAKVGKVYHVPGAFDAPFALKIALAKKNVDACIVLGAVVKGKTDHDEVVVEACASAISKLSLEFGKPVGFGVIGPDATWAYAKKVSEEYAKRAVGAAVELSRLK
ncbi:6,7-dimethyl-8-ribityllumazine synthase [Candidatus Parvarchaeota archaeon]|nr:6,7-dimethyl-8-ribityllumazine synthase [Candidatus Parvarchaeota archaeon]